MTHKQAQFCDDPKKLSTKSSYPQKIFIFLKTQKNIEIQNFEQKKNGPSLRICENIRVPPPPPPPRAVFYTPPLTAKSADNFHYQ